MFTSYFSVINWQQESSLSLSQKVILRYRSQMARRRIFVIAVLLKVSLMFRNISSKQCGIHTYSIYQMMLKGHTFKTFKARSLSFDCIEACNSEVRCQSYNYVMFKDICELNNRTKEARPEDFVKDRDRYYVMKAPNRGNITQQNIKIIHFWLTLQIKECLSERLFLL